MSIFDRPADYGKSPPLIFAVDFDGTLCENKWPEIGKAKPRMIEYCINLKACGHKLILHTCREGELLWDAIRWCAHNYNLTFDAHNENLPERIAQYGGNCRKVSADFYLDDKNLFIPEVFEMEDEK